MKTHTVYVPLGTSFSYIDENGRATRAENGITVHVSKDGAVESVRGFHGWLQPGDGTLQERIRPMLNSVQLV